MRIIIISLLAALMGCNNYSIDTIDRDPVDDLDGDDADDIAPVIHRDIPGFDPMPDPPEEAYRFLVLDKEEEVIDEENVRPIHTIDEYGIVINTIYAPGVIDMAFDDINAIVTLLLRGHGDYPNRLVNAGPSGILSDVSLSIAPVRVDFVSPYIVARDSNGVVAYRDVTSGFESTYHVEGRQWVANAFPLRIVDGIGLLDQATGCVMRLRPVSGHHHEFLCGLDFTGVVSVGSDIAGNYYFAQLGGGLWILESGIAAPTMHHLPDTYMVTSIHERDDESVWAYSSDTSASKGGHRLRRVWFDGVYDDTFHEPDQPWTDLVVID